VETVRPNSIDRCLIKEKKEEGGTRRSPFVLHRPGEKLGHRQGGRGLGDPAGRQGKKKVPKRETSSVPREQGKNSSPRRPEQRQEGEGKKRQELASLPLPRRLNRGEGNTTPATRKDSDSLHPPPPILSIDPREEKKESKPCKRKKKGLEITLFLSGEGL